MITLAFSLASLIGVKEQEAFQIQDNAATVFYALMYIVLFAIPLIAMKRFGVKAPLWLKLASASGLIVSVIAGFYTMIPITKVESPRMFALKIIVVVIVANAIGVVLFTLGRQRAEK
jgi:fructose-specific phosphotransferase system IIC component